MTDLDNAVVRRAVRADGPAAADVLIRARAAAAAAGTIPPGVHGDDEVRAWFTAVVLPDREVWVAAAPGDELVGVLVLEDDWVDQLYVAPAATGHGLGTRLLDLAKSLRPDGLQLWTFTSNLGAQRFYERHGFLAVERTDGSGNEERSPDIRYVWRPSRS
ncbi:MAG: N-acetyltransferase family protein [Actinomycetes bacterium]